MKKIFNIGTLYVILILLLFLISHIYTLVLYSKPRIIIDTIEYDLTVREAKEFFEEDKYKTHNSYSNHYDYSLVYEYEILIKTNGFIIKNDTLSKNFLRYKEDFVLR